MNISRLFYMAGLLSAALGLLPPRAQGTVYFIGIDGADRDVVAELVKAGRMPNLASIIEQGVLGQIDTLSPLPLSSPVIWTSMATGMGYKKHGITGFVKPGGAGWFRTPDRKTPALWNMVSSRRKTVGVAGFLLTAPAEPVNGVMISNNYFLPVGTNSVVYPGGLALRTSRAYIFGFGGKQNEAARIAGATPFELVSVIPSPKSYVSEVFQREYIFDNLTDYAQSDEGFARLDEELLEKNKFDLFITYFPGIDRVSHLAWRRYEAARSGKDAFFGNLVPNYYAHTDELIGRVLAGAGVEDTVIVTSDHGFKLRAGAGPLAVVSGDHRPGGIFAAKGPAIKKGAKLKKDLLDWDIAPTVLYLLGLPAARDMDGKVAGEILKEEYLAARPVSYVDKYPRAAAGRAQGNLPFTLEELERLRLSGYLQ